MPMFALLLLSALSIEVSIPQYVEVHPACTLATYGDQLECVRVEVLDSTTYYNLDDTILAFKGAGYSDYEVVFVPGTEKTAECFVIFGAIPRGVLPTCD